MIDCVYRAVENVGKEYEDCDQFVCSGCGVELQGWYRVEHGKGGRDVIYHDYVFCFCPNCGGRVK